MRRLSEILAAKTAAQPQPATSVQSSTPSAKPSASKPKAKTTKPKAVKTPPADALPPDPQFVATITSFLSQYFEEECNRDPEFAAKYRSGKKTAEQAFNYLYELHRPANKGKGAATNNDDDNLLAKQFIMDDSIPATKAEPKSKKSKGKGKEQVSLPPAQPKDDADLVLDGVTTPAPDAAEEHDALDDFDF